MSNNKPLSKKPVPRVVMNGYVYWQLSLACVVMCLGALEMFMETGPRLYMGILLILAAFSMVIQIVRELNVKTDAIDFAEFISGEGWQQYDGYDRWICPTESKDVISTETLYERYLKSKEGK